MKALKVILSGLFVIAFLSYPTAFSVKAEAAALPVLKVGITGPQVSELQLDLKTLGYFTYSSITGYYGAITKDSVTRFQKANNLTADGIAGQETQNKLNSLLSSLSSSKYTVSAGDTLFIISNKFGTTVENLKTINNLWTDTIYPGQVLKVGTQSGSIAVTASNLTESQNPDLYWLSRIIEAEASGEPYLGKVAVGNVILNRVSSTDFPDSVKGVIFEYYKGIPQFSPVADGTVYNTPSQDSINAALDALGGAKPVQNATYFFNPAKSSAAWIVDNKTYVMRIGNHVFYE